jgi:hypothetical protein
VQVSAFASKALEKGGIHFAMLLCGFRTAQHRSFGREATAKSWVSEDMPLEKILSNSIGCPQMWCRHSERYILEQ